MEGLAKENQNNNIVEVPSSFPIVSAEGEEMWFDNETDEGLVEDTIVFYTRFVPTKILKGYKLLRLIGGHEYVLRCSESSWGYYSLDFKTRGHEYARTQLSSEEADELGKSIQSFVASIRNNSYGEVERINISPADHSYTVEETERCKTEILEKFQTQFNENDRLSFFQDDKLGYLNKLPPFRIFKLYRELSGVDFERDTKHTSMAGARSRLFRSYLEKYLPDWQIDETPYSLASSEFQIIPKEKGGE